MNNHELLNIHTWSFLMFWNRGCTQALVVSWKHWVVPLSPTRVSGYSQVILLNPNVVLGVGTYPFIHVLISLSVLLIWWGAYIGCSVEVWLNFNLTIPLLNNLYQTFYRLSLQAFTLWKSIFWWLKWYHNQRITNRCFVKRNLHWHIISGSPLWGCDWSAYSIYRNRYR